MEPGPGAYKFKAMGNDKPVSFPKKPVRAARWWSVVGVPPAVVGRRSPPPPPPPATAAAR